MIFFLSFLSSLYSPIFLYILQSLYSSLLLSSFAPSSLFVTHSIGLVHLDGHLVDCICRLVDHSQKSGAAQSLSAYSPRQLHNKQTNKQTSSGSHYLYIYLAHFFIHFSLFLLFVSLILTACVAFNSRLFDLDCFHLPDHFVPWVFSPATFQFLLFLVPVPSPNISGLFSFPLWLSCLPHFSYKQV